MYWRFGFHNSSSIDTLLEKPDITVETILDEDDLLQECKTQNTRLIQYLQRPDVLRTLLGYVSGEIDADSRTGFKYPYLATEVLCSDIWSIVETCIAHADELLRPFWEAVLSKSPDELLGSPLTAARFTKIISVFLSKKPVEMLGFVKTVRDAIGRLLARMETPAIVDLLFRLVKSDSQMEGGEAVEWLASEGFIPKLVELLSPHQRPELHAAAADLLKDIISISSPAPGNVNIAGGSDDIAQEVSISNRLVRELAAERNAVILVGYMLGDDCSDGPSQSSEDPKKSQLTSSDSEAEDGSPADVSDTSSISLRETSSSLFSGSERSVGPSPSPSLLSSVAIPQTVTVDPEVAASSLIQCTSVVVELIRKNHSDYYEPVLFHTLRNRLLAAQQIGSGDGGTEEQGEDRVSLESTLALLSSNVGIVHLGHIVSAISVRLHEFQQLLQKPRMSCASIETTTGSVVPFTFERLRICELYAELFHTSNMGLLNRLPGEGPSYDSEGRLLGGLHGLEELAQVAASGPSDVAGSDRGVEDNDLQQAKELPISSSSTEASSMSGDDDLNEEVLQEIIVEEDDNAEPLSDAPDTRPSLTPQSITSPASVLDRTDDASITPHLNRLSLNSDPFRDPEHPLSEEETDEVINVTSSTQEQRASPTPLLPIGEQLKQRFLDLHVLKIFLDLFFDFPWNNFLHLVVYDVVHQVLTGKVEEGFNRSLTISLFRDARLVHRILDHDDESGSKNSGTSGGYRGHLMLIADDVITAYDQFSEELKHRLSGDIPQPQWDSYVVRHRIAREEANQTLGGSRPSGGPRRSAMFAQVDELAPSGSKPDVSHANGAVPNGPSPSLERSGVWTVPPTGDLEGDDNDQLADSHQEEDEEDEDEEDDEWGSFSSTSDVQGPVAFEDAEPFSFSAAPSISDRVLTIADLNSSFHAHVDANGSQDARDAWPLNDTEN